MPKSGFSLHIVGGTPESRKEISGVMKRFTERVDASLLQETQDRDRLRALIAEHLNDEECVVLSKDEWAFVLSQTKQ